MLIEQPAELDRTFAALADPTRREILSALSGGEMSAGLLVERFTISAPAISRHLRVLEEAGLINRRVDGKHRRFQLDPQPLQAAVRWLEFYRQFWSESLQQLADHFESAASSSPSPAKTKRSKHVRRKSLPR